MLYIWPLFPVSVATVWSLASTKTFSVSFLMPRLSSSANFGPLWKYKAEALAQLHTEIREFPSFARNKPTPLQKGLVSVSMAYFLVPFRGWSYHSNAAAAGKVINRFLLRQDSWNTQIRLTRPSQRWKVECPCHNIVGFGRSSLSPKFWCRAQPEVAASRQYVYKPTPLFIGGKGWVPPCHHKLFLFLQNVFI